MLGQPSRPVQPWATSREHESPILQERMGGTKGRNRRPRPEQSPRCNVHAFPAETIFRTNLQSSYAVRTMEAIEESKADMPYPEYEP